MKFIIGQGQKNPPPDQGEFRGKFAVTFHLFCIVAGMKGLQENEKH